MTIDFDCGFGDDPPPRHVNPTVSDDGYMVIGGQLVYVGVSNNQPVQSFNIERSVRQPHPDDDWLDLGTQCIYVGK